MGQPLTRASAAGEPPGGSHATAAAHRSLLPAAFTTWLVRRDLAYTRLEQRARGWRWPTVVMAGLVLLAASQQQAGVAPLGLTFDPARQPVVAAAYLRAQPPAGNGFNDMGWGGYLLHALWPAQRVFIDGQTDFYGESLAREYLRVTELMPGWESVLDRYGVQWVIYPSQSPLVRQLAATPDWRVAHQDVLATVLTRAPEGGRGH